MRQLMKLSVTIELVGEVSVFAVVDSVASLPRVEAEEQCRVADGSTSAPEIEAILRVAADNFPQLAAITFTPAGSRMKIVCRQLSTDSSSPTIRRSIGKNTSRWAPPKS